MPRDKKKIHDLLSPKIAAKRRRRNEVNQARARAIASGEEKAPVPASVDNFKINKPLFGPHKIRGLVVPVVQRKISPTEGKPTVNGKSGKDIKPLIHKPVNKNRTPDPTAGVIEAKSLDKKKKSRGRPKKRV